MKRMLRWRWPGIALALATVAANATVVKPRELGDLVSGSSFVGSVWIEQSTAISDGPALSYPACGASYRARTVDVLKGKVGTVTFYATEDLVAGREYLVLLTQGLKSATDVVSTTNLSGTSRRTESQWLVDCAARYPGLWAIHGSVASFADRRLRVELPGRSVDRWIALPSYLVQYDISPEFDTDKIGAPWSFGPTPFPTGVYVSWQSARAVLLQAISKPAFPPTGRQ